MRSVFASARVVALFAAVRSAIAYATPPPGLAPAIYEHGNLRVAVACAETPLSTGAGGLRVYVDGVLLEELATNGDSYTTSDSDGNVETGWAASDVGFLVTPGQHHVRVEAPDCVADERDLELAADYAERLIGRLAVRDPDLATPTGGASSFSFVLGGYSGSPGITATGSSGTGSLASTYTIDSASRQGVLLSTGIERRSFALWIDEAIGRGAISGMVAWQQPPVGTAPAGPLPYTGSFIENGLTLRLGARLPLGNVALAAGTGIGASLFVFSSSHVTMSSDLLTPLPPEGVDLEWYVPAWTAITYKPSCNWGVQAIASYNLEPSSGFAGTMTWLGGIELQPAAACAESPHVAVKP